MAVQDRQVSRVTSRTAIKLTSTGQLVNTVPRISGEVRAWSNENFAGGRRPPCGHHQRGPLNTAFQLTPTPWALFGLVGLRAFAPRPRASNHPSVELLRLAAL